MSLVVFPLSLCSLLTLLPEANEASMADMADMTDVLRSSAGSRHAATNSRSWRCRDVTVTVADTSGVERSGVERRGDVLGDHQSVLEQL